MSKSYDERSAIKLEPELEKALNEIRKRTPVKSSLASTANAAIRLGIVMLQNPTAKQFQLNERTGQFFAV